MKKIVISFVIAIVAVSSLFAANGYYEKGDTAFTVKVGMILPDCLYFPSAKTDNFLLGPKDMHATIGGSAALSYQAFVSRNWALGAELAYDFDYSKSKLIFTAVPVTFKASYVPVQNGTFDLFVNANVGISLLKYNDQKYLSPAFASISVNPVYYFNQSWGIGIDAGIYSNIELYSGAKKAESCIAAFSPITLTLNYRH